MIEKKKKKDMRQREYIFLFPSEILYSFIVSIYGSIFACS